LLFPVTLPCIAFSDIMSFAGATAGMLLMTGFQGAFAIKLFGKRGLDTMSDNELLLHYAVLALTGVLVVLGVYASAVAIAGADFRNIHPFQCTASTNDDD
jgi:hypothetical protein